MSTSHWPAPPAATSKKPPKGYGFIYVLFDAKGCARYVGSTIHSADRRLGGHVGEARRGKDHHRANGISEVLRETGAPPVVRIVRVVSIDILYDVETAYIAMFGGVLDRKKEFKSRLWNTAAEADRPPAYEDWTPEQKEANVERARAMHADPAFAKANAERASEQMRAKHAEPEYAKAHSERARVQWGAIADRSKGCRLRRLRKWATPCDLEVTTTDSTVALLDATGAVVATFDKPPGGTRAAYEQARAWIAANSSALMVAPC